MEANTYCFRVTKRVYFNITTGGQDHRNKENGYFSTSADFMNRNRTDYQRTGQCQEALPKGKAHSFYLKWDKKHLEYMSRFSEEELKELYSDIEELKKNYPYVIGDMFSDKVLLDRKMSK